MPRSFFAVLLAALAAALLPGCADLRYYWQSVQGHTALMGAAAPLADWLARPGVPAPLRERLQLAVRARDFAVTDLALPDNGSYRSYAALDRPAAVWNVVAAPPDALTPHQWCFVVVGCISYRGYFAQADAQAEAARLAAQGLEVYVHGVPAYSTLGYLDGLGGDPLLSTFITWPEGEFVRLLFHELAHQVVYAKNDSAFNESFATAVERLGSARWLASRSTPAQQQAFADRQQQRQAFRALAQATRRRLAELYDAHQAQALAAPALAALKSEAMQDFRSRYAQLRQQWQAPLAQVPMPALQAAAAEPMAPAQLAGYDRWVAQANNASFAAQATYDHWVPAFETLFAQQEGDWKRFYAAVQALAALPPPLREERLQALLQGAPEPGPSAPSAGAGAGTTTPATPSAGGPGSLAPAAAPAFETATATRPAAPAVRRLP